ncbi:MAG: FAD-dependent oxidoreductase [Acidobacteria bacterium]|nr:MAG: FAD-dependent oxidoreductase [Acidobacteriota bacterium]
MNSYDALVIGGGPGGATAARLLAKAGWSVAVVEKAQFPRRKVCGEYLAPTNYPLFKELGILDDFLRSAGPEVRRIELVLKGSTITSPMPRPERAHAGWGRALRRDTLDALLLSSAARAGARVWQPWSVVGLKKSGGRFVSEVVSKKTDEAAEIESRVVVAAHGSWGVGHLPTQLGRRPARSSDLFAFKAHFDNAALPADVMNMLVFPGGYAGMVNTDGGLLSFSFCVRRDYMETLRRASHGARPGQVVQDHILKSCAALGGVMSGARLRDDWLSAGPIRPGIRKRFEDGIFFIGNAAGEAHPTIADGISMAMQSAWLLSQHLGGTQPRDLTDSDLRKVGRAYDRAWLKAFRFRIWAAEAFARLALAPQTHALLLPLARAFPRFLTVGARMGGIVDEVVAST